MTTKPKIIVAGIEREMNEDEYAQHLKDLEDFAKEKTDRLTAEQAAKIAKATAEAKLIALGLNADDLKALGLGGN